MALTVSMAAGRPMHMLGVAELRSGRLPNAASALSRLGRGLTATAARVNLRGVQRAPCGRG